MGIPYRRIGWCQQHSHNSRSRQTHHTHMHAHINKIHLSWFCSFIYIWIVARCDVTTTKHATSIITANKNCVFTARLRCVTNNWSIELGRFIFIVVSNAFRLFHIKRRKKWSDNNREWLSFLWESKIHGALMWIKKPKRTNPPQNFIPTRSELLQSRITVFLSCHWLYCCLDITRNDNE